MELNEAELIQREITIRSLRITKEVLETRRAMIRWLALSLGIINPGESRLSALAVLDALIHYQFVKKTEPSAQDLTDYINANWEQINEKTLRYHLGRIKKMGFVENAHGKFYFKPPVVGDKYDAAVWARGVLEADYKDIAMNVGSVINELKNKNATGTQ